MRLLGLEALERHLAEIETMRKARHIMTVYRRHLLGCKKKWGSARGLIHYRALLDSYLKAKRAVLAGEELVDA